MDTNDCKCIRMNVNKSMNKKCSKLRTKYERNMKDIRTKYDQNTNEIRMHTNGIIRAKDER